MHVLPTPLVALFEGVRWRALAALWVLVLAATALLVVTDAPSVVVSIVMGGAAVMIAATMVAGARARPAATPAAWLARKARRLLVRHAQVDLAVKDAQVDLAVKKTQAEFARVQTLRQAEFARVETLRQVTSAAKMSLDAVAAKLVAIRESLEAEATEAGPGSESSRLPFQLSPADAPLSTSEREVILQAFEAAVHFRERMEAGRIDMSEITPSQLEMLCDVYDEVLKDLRRLREDPTAVDHLQDDHLPSSRDKS
jgi:hypothetical protein